MNAIEFITARAAICKYYGGVMGGCSKGADKCPLSEIECDISPNMSVQDAERMQAIVDKWMHRDGETNGDKFREIFGDEFIDMWSLSDISAEEWAKQKYERG